MIIFQKYFRAKKGPLGLGISSSYLDIDSPNLPPLLESPCIPTNVGGEISFESQSAASSMDQQKHVAYFSTPRALILTSPSFPISYIPVVSIQILIIVSSRLMLTLPMRDLSNARWSLSCICNNVLST